MKQFFGYDITGRLTYLAVSNTGFDQSFDIYEESPLHELAKTIKTDAQTKGIVGFVSIDCNCGPSENCGCHNTNMDSYYVNLETKNIVMKPTGILSSGGNPVDAFLVLPPSTKQVFNVVCDAPNGAEALVQGSKLSPYLPMTLVFNSGKTNDFTLISPAQGLSGKILITSKWFPKLRLEIFGSI